MRLSSLSVTALLLLSSATFAQHSSTGSSSSSASSSSSGGASHSSSSASSSSSSSSSGGHSASPSSGSASFHSSGGSVSRSSNARVSGGAVAHTSTVSGSSSSAASSPHFNLRESNSNSNPTRSIREPSTGMRTTTPQPEKRTFFSFLRHPFKRPQPNPEPTAVANLRHRVCLSGPCLACPAGQGRIGGGCAPTASATYIHTHTFCPAGEIWSGGACILQVRFLDDCSSLRLLMERQAQSMQAAESARQGACSAGSTQECATLDSTAQSEANLYRTLQDRYRLCLQRSRTAYTFSGFPFKGYSTGIWFEPFGID
jgi:hypothetical protein